MVQSVLAFAAFAALLTVVPGADTALVIRATLGGGRRVAFAGTVGISVGALSWAAATAAGLSALIAAAPVLYEVLHLAGAGYLGYLGVSALLRVRRGQEGAPPGAVWNRPLAAFRAGLLTNLLNPKVGAFYLSVVPLFLPADAPVVPFTLLLALVHVGEGLLWLTVVAWLVSRARAVLTGGRLQRAVEALTGVTLLALGARLALSGP